MTIENHSTLPIEVQWLIIEEALYGLPIFSINPLYKSGINHDKWMCTRELFSLWQKLRLVCHSWKQFVDSDQVKYSYIDLQHFMPEGGGIPPLIHAKRLDMRNELYSPPYHRVDPIVFKASILNCGGTQIQILTNVDFEFANFILDHSLFPQLKALEIGYLRSSAVLEVGTLSKISRRFKLLECLHVCLPSVFSHLEDVLDLPKLKSLDIVGFSLHGLEYCALEKWNLPSLEYLEVKGVVQHSHIQRALDSFGFFGNKLKTLKLHIPIQSYKTVLERTIPLTSLWDGCPNLEYLYAPLLAIMHYPPRAPHPIRVILTTGKVSVVHEVMQHGPGMIEKERAPLLPIDKFCETAPRLEIIRDAFDWGERVSLIRPSLHYYSARRMEQWRLLYRISEELRSQGIRFEDMHGKTLEEYENDTSGVETYGMYYSSVLGVQLITSGSCTDDRTSVSMFE